MECSKVQEKLSSYLDRAIDEASLEAVEAHIEGCEECRSELKALRSVIQLTSMLPEVEPPIDMVSSIKDSVKKDQEVAAACAMYLPMLSEYIDNELSNESVIELELHLQACSSCSREFEQLKVTVDAIDLVTDVVPPTDLRERIAAATTGSRTLAGARERVLRVKPRLGWVAGMAAAAAVIGIIMHQPHGLHQKAIGAITPVKPAVDASVPVELKQPGQSIIGSMKPKAAPSKPRREVVAVTEPIDKSRNHRSYVYPVQKPKPAASITAKVEKSRTAEAISKRIAMAPPTVTAHENPPVVMTAEKPAEPAPQPAVEPKPVVIKLPNKPAVNSDVVDKFFKDVKTVARMNQRDSDRIEVDVASKKF